MVKYSDIVLDMSSIEKEKMQLVNEPFNFKQMITELANDTYIQARSKEIDFSVKLEEIQREILIGDGIRVAQVIRNILSNSLKFTDAGGQIQLVIMQMDERDNHAYFRIEISDTGCGIDKKNMGDIFEPFVRAKEDATVMVGGSGLGLAITKNLVQLMKGTIEIESKKGKGTTVIMDLGFEVTDDILPKNEPHLQSIWALVVDDDEDARTYISAVLQRLGVKHDIVASGVEALEAMKLAEEAGLAYDVCFVDWKMPQMDGVELTRKIREEYQDESMIIIVSSFDLNEIREEAKDAGADYFVTKPVFQSSVYNALMRLDKVWYEIEKEETFSYDFTGHKVLVVEDNELNTEILVALLGMVHMDTITVDNGKKAVELFESSKPDTFDAILMDIQMPVMNGYEATKVIRQMEREDASTIPIFAVSANAFKEDVSTALSAGMDGHIAKPFNRKELYEILDNICMD